MEQQTSNPEPTESKTDRLLDLVDAVNVLARVEAVVGFFLANRRKSKKHPNKKRPAGAVELRVPRDYGGTGNDVQDILTRHGVESWGGRVNGKFFIMYVKARQAQWGIGILRGKGVDVESSVDAPATTASHTWQHGPEAAAPVPTTQPKRKRKPKPEPKRTPGITDGLRTTAKRWL